MDEQHRAADLVGILEDGLVQEGHGAGDVPALVRVEGPGMVAPGGLVVGVVVLDKEGRVVGQGVHHAARPGVNAGLVVGGALGVQGRALGVALRLAVVGVKVAFGPHPAHVVHGGSHRGFDPGVQGGGVQGHAAPAADADDADLVRVRLLLHRQEIDGGLKVLGVDVGAGHIAGLAAALTGKGRVEGDGQKAAAGHFLGVKAGGLLFDGAEGPADGQGGQRARSPFGPVEVGGQGDAVPVVERHLPVLHTAVLGEGLVPFLGQMQLFFHRQMPSVSSVRCWSAWRMAKTRWSRQSSRAASRCSWSSRQARCRARNLY